MTFPAMMDEGKKYHGLEEEESAGRWLSCKSDYRGMHSAKRKRKGVSLRKPILLQKKLPRHWRENDDELLTELDLLQPKASATKQSSLLSFVAVGEKSKPLDLPRTQAVRDSDIKTVLGEDDIDNNNRQDTYLKTAPTLNSSEVYICSQDNECHISDSSSREILPLSEQETKPCGGDENWSSEGSTAEAVIVTDVKETRFDQDQDSRRFIMALSTGNNEILSEIVPDGGSSYLTDDKDFRVLSLKNRVRVEGRRRALVDTNINDSQMQHIEHNEEEVTDALSYCSQNSSPSSDDDYSDKFDLCDKDEKFLRSATDYGDLKDDSGRKRNRHVSSIEESLTFTNREYDSCLSESPLTESQKARKEFYKAKMGTLHFSEFTDLS